MSDFKVTTLERDLDFDQLPYWDVVIIGAGPAGLAAGLTTAHRALTTLVIEAKDRPGGQPQFLYADKRIVDIPGFPDGITGEELSQRTYRQASDALVQFRFNEELTAIDDTEQVETEDRLKRVVTTKGSYLCRKVIVACGLLHYPRRLNVLDLLGSKNVHYKIPKIGDYEGNRVAVIGGGDSALD
ncbi:MAG TPA: NAD(P)/FAD-dependent oxidoreductase, partial [Planctomycetaceae bacterium]|nr:NAD(P)/FAD-dependent oxidoreductase [Planctomycetaceae bacterium]